MYSTLRSGKIGMSRYFIVLFTLSLLIAGCSKDDDYSTNGSSSTGTQGANEIFISGMAFSPASKTIAIGTTIKWINKDGTTHTVTSGTPGSPSGTFNSGNFGQNGEFSFKFDQAGTFNYFCNIHQSMTGTIIVQ